MKLLPNHLNCKTEQQKWPKEQSTFWIESCLWYSKIKSFSWGRCGTSNHSSKTKSMQRKSWTLSVSCSSSQASLSSHFKTQTPNPITSVSTFNLLMIHTQLLMTTLCGDRECQSLMRPIIMCEPMTTVECRCCTWWSACCHSLCSMRLKSTLWFWIRSRPTWPAEDAKMSETFSCHLSMSSFLMTQQDM